MEGVVAILGLTVFAFFLLFMVITMRRKKTVGKIALVDSELAVTRKEIVSVTTGGIPGKTIRSTLGSIVGISNTAATTDEEFSLAEKEAMRNVLIEAKNLGANAVIGLRMSSGTYQRQGSRWLVTKVTYHGTAVHVANC